MKRLIINNALRLLNQLAKDHEKGHHKIVNQ